DLFRAVVLNEAQAVAAEIEREPTRPLSPLDALMAGADAWFQAMAVPGRARLLLIDGPSVLGHAEMNRIDEQTGGRSLRDGLAAALGPAASKKLPLDALAQVVSAAFDRAALAVAAGEPSKQYNAALRMVLQGLVEAQVQR
ncbi:MAG: TetR/AcrR family transcriptional regulator, partial [Burkholderiales bacterium]